MEASDSASVGYGTDEVSRLGFIWGQGFMSPGGPAEVARTLDGADLRGMHVLDIGCGVGGVDLLLVQDHGADRVTGIDVQQDLLVLAAARVAEAGLTDRIAFHLVEPGPLPFPDESFDAVFSKDAIIHVHDKVALYAEAFRVLRPGGLLRVSDWLRGDGDENTQKIADLVGEAGHDFTMWSLEGIRDIVRGVGFVDVDLEDRNAWYLDEARRELASLVGPARLEFTRTYGDQAATDEIEFWQLLVDSLEQGALRPGHVRAGRPAG
jgi:phosphoethanolamine N-methyltransferase